MDIVEFVDNYFENANEGAYETLSCYKEMLDEMLRYTPDEFYSVIKKELKHNIRIQEERCIEDNVCPECGEKMVYSTVGAKPTYVPYGSTVALYDDGGHWECECCGYKVDD